MIHNLYKEIDIIVVGLQETYQTAGGMVSSNLPLMGQDPLVESFGEFLVQKGLLAYHHRGCRGYSQWCS